VCASFAAPALQSHFEKSWPAHTQMKGSLLDVLALVVGGMGFDRALTGV
jgi:hypothetical protein